MSERLICGDTEREISVKLARDGTGSVRLDGVEYAVDGVELQGSAVSFSLAGQRYRFDALVLRDAVCVATACELRSFATASNARQSKRDEERGGLVSRMPGKVLLHRVEAGAQVQRGDVLLILEAMKMEHEVRAPEDGAVAGFLKQPGERVMPGELLVDFVPGAATSMSPPSAGER